MTLRQETRCSARLAWLVAVAWALALVLVTSPGVAPSWQLIYLGALLVFLAFCLGVRGSATVVAIAAVVGMAFFSILPGMFELRMADVDIAKENCRQYHEAAEDWVRFGHDPPRHLEDMQSPRQPGEEDFLRFCDDPWGGPYVLEREGGVTRVCSWGPDGLRGTDDDIRWPGDD